MINKQKDTMTKDIKIYASIQFPKDWTGRKDISITTLEKHLERYNKLNEPNKDVNGLKLFLSEHEAREHFKKINQ